LIQKSQLYNKKTQNALEILDAGLYAALPKNSLAGVIKENKLLVGNKSYLLSKYRKIYVIAVGKAADTMAKLIHSKIKLARGIIVIPQNYKPVFHDKKFKIHHTGHPIPNKSSIVAAKSILTLLKNAEKNDLVIFLISGGASALVCLPEGITLVQKQRMTRLLLKCGATIDEINSIRKHLSSIKGGKLAQNLPCSAISLVMSDVVGNNLASIGSGLTYFDDSTFSDCMKIIQKYHLERKTPLPILKRFRLGIMGKIAETPKKPIIQNFIVATNKDCVDAMAKKATSLGYKTKTFIPVSGDVKNAAKRILQNFSNTKKSCLVFGGETTVKVTGCGRGGRSQELVLRILQNLEKNSSVVVASIGTDGIDGNTKYAGAISDFIPNKNEIKNYLKENNSNAFFKKHNRLILTGPTHTNLMDVGLILKL
jgi:hydroxypyruvate reductase